MTKREAAIISAYTGILVGDFSAMHEYVEEVMEGPIWTHQFASKEFNELLKEKVKPDLLVICDNITEN